MHRCLSWRPYLASSRNRNLSQEGKKLKSSQHQLRLRTLLTHYRIHTQQSLTHTHTQITCFHLGLRQKPDIIQENKTEMVQRKAKASVS